MMGIYSYRFYFKLIVKLILKSFFHLIYNNFNFIKTIPPTLCLLFHPLSIQYILVYEPALSPSKPKSCPDTNHLGVRRAAVHNYLDKYLHIHIIMRGGAV